jgi:hypothetical protein
MHPSQRYFIIPQGDIISVAVAPWSRDTLYCTFANGLTHCVSREDGRIFRTWGTAHAIASSVNDNSGGGRRKKSETEYCNTIVTDNREIWVLKRIVDGDAAVACIDVISFISSLSFLRRPLCCTTIISFFFFFLLVYVRCIMLI